MTQLKLRTRILSTIAAVALVPASALAQSGQGDTSAGATDYPSATGSQSGSQSSRTQPSTGSSQGSRTGQSGSTTMSPTSPSGTSASTQSPSAQSPSAQSGSGQANASGSAQRSQQTLMNTRSAQIDPAEVQKVFGSDVTLIDLTSLSPEQVRSLQQALGNRGFYQGQIDGVMGPQTRAAVSTMLAQQFALNQRLINQGKITESLASSIGLQNNDLSPVRGIDSTQGMTQPSQTSPSSPQGTSQRSGTTGTRSGSSTSGSSSSGSMNSGSSSSGPNHGSSTGSNSGSNSGSSNSGSSNSGTNGSTGSGR